MVGEGSDRPKLPLSALKRAESLSALRDGPLARHELQDRLGVSRTTVHRIVSALEDDGLLVRDDDGYELTGFGHTTARAVDEYRETITAAERLQPLLDCLPTTFDVPVRAFSDARLTTQQPGNPYAPVERFVGCLRESGSLRGIDTTSIAPIYVDAIRAEILAGMTTDVVYLPSVVTSIVEAYPDDVARAVESGELTLRTHDDLPCGLAIFDDRVALGGYDPETGMLRAFADTDDPEARAWALDVYDDYVSAGTVFYGPNDTEPGLVSIEADGGESTSDESASADES
ncbi:helix-turn-helix transcriptional regulator [Salinirubrum litoreum]|uniref:Helix-turn-helix transcriptional regulator n=1 Tax=Salinirubrum litoreum TaxID=1126234 RepID=A0ABD5RCV6_9EURY|nr:helix-turn-helix domain-containing protein [Salinirubrum litoreum]